MKILKKRVEETERSTGFMPSMIIIVAIMFMQLSFLKNAQAENIDKKFDRVVDKKAEKNIVRNIEKIIGAYPPIDSQRHQLDFDRLYFFQNTRTLEMCKRAQLEEKLTLETFFGGEHALLSKKEIRRLNFKAFFKFLQSGILAMIAKNKFKRPRPFITDSQIVPCISRPVDFSYPSGHAMVARTWAIMLSHKFPERASAFMKRAHEIGIRRVVGGVHHPSDIVAGNKLADALASKLLSSKEIRKVILQAL